MWVAHQVLFAKGRIFHPIHESDLLKAGAEGFAIFSPNSKDAFHKMLTHSEAIYARNSASTFVMVHFKEIYQYLVSTETTLINRLIILTQGKITHPENISDILHRIDKGEALFIVENNDSALVKMAWLIDAEKARIAGHTIYAADFGTIYQHLISTYAK